MRLSNVVLVLSLGGLAGISSAGCGDDSTGGGGAGGTSTSSSKATSTSTSASSGGSTAACDPKDAVCTVGKSKCIGLVDNAGKTTFALRMSQLDVTKPPALVGGAVGPLIANGVQLKLSKCNLSGTGTFNLLLEFDKTAKKMTAGGAAPVTDPTKGYSFLTATVLGKPVAPVTTDIAIAEDGTFTPAKGVDIFLPIYLGTSPDPAVILPLKQALITGKLSTDNNCIGTYNASALDPAKDCVANATTPTFLVGADLDSHITLEDADSVVIGTPLNQSLCVLLSGDPAKFGDGMTPAKCKRTANVIDYKGDWCTGTNMTASGTCADAVKLAGKLAASAILRNP